MIKHANTPFSQNNSRALKSLILLILTSLALGCSEPQSPAENLFLPGGRVLLDAHNAYPYEGKWTDRIERALGTGFPLAVEQDLCWYTEPDSGEASSVVAHGEPLTDEEPSLRAHFFERIRSLAESELQKGRSADWPVVVLNLDIKEEGRTEQHLSQVLALVREYGDWITSAPRTSIASTPAALDVRPVLVLTGSSRIEERAFHDDLAEGERLLIFGAVEVSEEEFADGGIPSPSATNYRRWWNNPWKVVEPEGQRDAGTWSTEESERLQALVKSAHRNHLWIRFYTLNGHPESEIEARGWSAGYNFGSIERAQKRWQAAIEAGVDFVATDQYEDFSKFAKKLGPSHE